MHWDSKVTRKKERFYTYIICMFRMHKVHVHVRRQEKGQRIITKGVMWTESDCSVSHTRNFSQQPGELKTVNKVKITPTEVVSVSKVTSGTVHELEAPPSLTPHKRHKRLFSESKHPPGGVQS